tara:strand:+ start:25719 stop:25979 length:261 start_codon:yes stop_codon:yes gene_type:complete
MSMDVNHFLSDEKFKEKIKSGVIYLDERGILWDSRLVDWVDIDSGLVNGTELDMSHNEPQLMSIGIPESFDRFLILRREMEINKIL